MRILIFMTTNVLYIVHTLASAVAAHSRNNLLVVPAVHNRAGAPDNILPLAKHKLHQSKACIRIHNEVSPSLCIGCPGKEHAADSHHFYDPEYISS